MTNIKKATANYEAWLGARTVLVEQDLDSKHALMASGAFPFLRGTFYRWAQVWPDVCKDLARAPAVLAVGDLHVENFGTWRDTEGRLVWGVNDFDEAYPMAYTNDLVRLAVSARLAIAADHLHMTAADACEAILAGYADSLKAGGGAFVLAETHAWLHQIAQGALIDPKTFWDKMDALPTLKEGIPASAREAMESLLPDEGLSYRVARRTAGVGSLGHERFVALAEWCGGHVAREAKALTPSSVVWARGDSGPIEVFYQALVTRAKRACDPYVQLRGQWIVRRLAPDCARIELSSLPQTASEARLLHAMGWETANIHLGSESAIKAVRQDLKARSKGWLASATEDMAAAVQRDWQEWAKK